MTTLKKSDSCWRNPRHVSLSLLGLAALYISPSVQAVPSFSRQTGVACAMCHTQSFGPNLTPYGREFKLNGYVWESSSKEEKYIPPISGMVVGSFTNTKSDQQTQPGPVDGNGNNIQHFNTNNNFAFDQASLFYAGKIWNKVGAFSQLTYDGVADTLFMDNTDVRFANQVDVFGQSVVYGLSGNNNPTVQDLWNTTPAWGYPFASSPVAPTPAAATLFDGGLAGVGTGQVGGGTFYSMINREIYLEAGAYGSYSSSFMKGTGNYQWSVNGLSPLSRIDGAAPYWRLALQKNVNGHYFALGHFGMAANIHPYGDTTNGTDFYTDLGLDATYQYLANLDHIFEMKGSFIRETRDLKASEASAYVVSRSNYVNSFKLNGAYTFEQTYGVTLGYNKIWARADASIDPSTGVILPGGSEGSEYLTAELTYVPFGKTYTALSSLMNLRVGLQYIGYTQFDGTHIQSGSNNTFLLNGWLAF